MELPNYDWAAYRKAIQNNLFDHPDLAHKVEVEAVQSEWNNVLKELEPFRR